MAARSGPEPGHPHGWLCVDVLHAGAGHRHAGGAVCTLLHVARRSGAALLLVFSGLHGCDGGRGAGGQYHSAGVLLGTDQPVFVLADRLLAPPARCAARRAHGAHRHRHGRPVPAGGHAGHRPHCGQLRPRSCACCRPAGARSPAVPHGPCFAAAGRFHQERAVSVPFLAATRHGRAHACVGVSAFGHHGQGRCFFAGPHVARDGWHRALVLAGGRCRPGHAAGGWLCGNVPERPEGAARLLDHFAPGPHHPAAGPEQPAGRRGGGLSHHEPRHLQGVAVHGRRHCGP